MKRIKNLLIVAVCCAAGCSLEAPPGGDCGTNEHVGESMDCQCVVPNDHKPGSSSSVSVESPVKVNTFACLGGAAFSINKLADDEVVACVNYKCQRRQCPEGYNRDMDDPFNLTCISEKDKTPEPICGTHEIFDPEAKACVCDSRMHYTGTAGNCKCEEGYSESNEGCVENHSATKSCGKGEIYSDSAHDCICDTSDHWVGMPGKCECEQGYHETSGKCVGEEHHSCQKGEIYSDSAQDCICDTSNHWVENAGKCECEQGYHEAGEECILNSSEKQCDKGEIYSDSAHDCICDTSDHWIGDAGKCECEKGYLEVSGKCVENNDQVICGKGEIYSSSDKKCICDTSHHWVGKPGECKCEGNYDESNGECSLVSPQPQCGLGEIYSDAEEKCVCDIKKHWELGDKGVCVCAKEYHLNQQNQCILCEGDTIWDEVSLSCIAAPISTLPSCAESNNLKVGDTCTFGRYVQDADGKTKTDLEWLVLEINSENNVLLLSKYVIEAMAYYSLEYLPITWEECSVRNWLNGHGSKLDDATDFIKEAFNEKEYQKLLMVKNINPDNHNSGAPGGKDTEDYVFLLSMDDIVEYKVSITGGVPTKYVINLSSYGAFCKNMSCDWLLRSPGELPKEVYYVSENNMYDQTPVNNIKGIRPALWIRRN